MSIGLNTSNDHPHWLANNNFPHPMSFQVRYIVQHVKSVIAAQLWLLYEPSYSLESSVITPGLLQREIDMKQPCPHIQNCTFGEVFAGPPCRALRIHVFFLWPESPFHWGEVLWSKPRWYVPGYVHVVDIWIRICVGILLWTLNEGWGITSEWNFTILS